MIRHGTPCVVSSKMYCIRGITCGASEFEFEYLSWENLRVEWTCLLMNIPKWTCLVCNQSNWASGRDARQQMPDSIMWLHVFVFRISCLVYVDLPIYCCLYCIRCMHVFHVACFHAYLKPSLAEAPPCYTSSPGPSVKSAPCYHPERQIP